MQVLIPLLCLTLNAGRLTYEGLDDEHIDFVGDLTTPFYADAGYAYSLMDINWRHNQSTFYHFTSDHRISGWKETNAMYVALNSQFSA